MSRGAGAKTRLRIAMMGLLAFSLLAWMAAAAAVSGTRSSQLTARGGTFGPEKGWLVVDGGEEPVLSAIARRFVRLAGGPEANIVLVPTAMHNPSEEEIETYEKWLDAKNITVLSTHDPAVANSEAFVAPLRKATGVWFTGGIESNIVNAYVGTLTQKELEAVLARGGVVGGSSAGAFVLGAIALIPPKRSPSGFVPEDNRTFGFVHNVFIIPHVIQMNWENRMAEGMAMYRGLLGIGVDAGAAIVIHGNQCEVIGDSKVLLPNGRGPDHKGYEVLTAGARFDLAQAMKRANVQPAQSKNQVIVRPH
jgi:cyanophycinase